MASPQQIDILVEGIPADDGVATTPDAVPENFDASVEDNNFVVRQLTLTETGMTGFVEQTSVADFVR